MPRYNFPKDDPIPQNDNGYHCRVLTSVESIDKKGRTVWDICCEILHGPFAGQWLRDRVWWTEQAEKRVRLVLSRFGVLREGAHNYDAGELVDREILIFPEIEEYNEELRNKIAFDGYQSVEGDGDASEPPPLGEVEPPPF